MKFFLLIGCSVSLGWMIRQSIEDVIQRINDWRESACWAALAAACITGVVYFFF